MLSTSIFTVNPLAMFTRRYSAPDHSFFLFGPRGTGKTTWLRQVLPEVLWFDLLRAHTLLAFTLEPQNSKTVHSVCCRCSVS